MGIGDLRINAVVGQEMKGIDMYIGRCLLYRVDNITTPPKQCKKTYND
jgi:hypothetical protein